MPRSGNWLRPLKRRAIYERDGRACVYCGSDERLVVDHITPRARGGSNEATNLVTACKRCNDRKRGLLLSEFVPDPRERRRVRNFTRRCLARVIERIRFEAAVERGVEAWIRQQGAHERAAEGCPW